MKGVFLFFLQLLINVVPKDRESVYVKQSIPFKDNVAAVLDQLKNRNDLRIYIHGSNLSEYLGGSIVSVKPNSIKSIWHFIRSKYVLYDNGVYGSIYSKKQVTVHLTHGNIFKKYGYLTEESFQEHRKYSFLPHRIVTNAIVSAPIFVKPTALAMGIDESDVWVTGLPRNDYILSEEPLPQSDLLCKITEHRKAIIWMPTYRHSQNATSSSNGLDYEFGLPLIDNDRLLELDGVLRELDCILVIKNHTLQDRTYNLETEFSNILFVDSDDIVNEQLPINGFMNIFDALISDYSSVVFDYLLLDRPICHIVDDYDVYKSNRGFVFDNAIDLLPGDLVVDYDGLISFIKSVCDGKDEGKDKRAQMAKVLNSYCDVNNASRVLKQIGL